MVCFSLWSGALLSVHSFLFPLTSLHFASPLLIIENIARLQMRPYVPVCVCVCNYVCLMMCAAPVEDIV